MEKERIQRSLTEGPSEMQHCQLMSCENKAEQELKSTITFSCSSLQTTDCSDNPSQFTALRGHAVGLATGTDNQISWAVLVGGSGIAWPHLHHVLMDSGA